MTTDQQVCTSSFSSFQTTYWESQVKDIIDGYVLDYISEVGDMKVIHHCGNDTRNHVIHPCDTMVLEFNEFGTPVWMEKKEVNEI